jgi:hypothetical protein
MFNSSLQDQLKNAVKSGQVKVVYPKGYQKWKKKFDYWMKITGSVSQTLNILYGPNGSVDDYKGSIYNNSNFKAQGNK